MRIFITGTSAGYLISARNKQRYGIDIRTFFLSQTLIKLKLFYYENSIVNVKQELNNRI
jgi:hypothetical protein